MWTGERYSTYMRRFYTIAKVKLIIQEETGMSSWSGKRLTFHEHILEHGTLKQHNITDGSTLNVVHDDTGGGLGGERRRKWRRGALGGIGAVTCLVEEPADADTVDQDSMSTMSW